MSDGSLLIHDSQSSKNCLTINKYLQDRINVLDCSIPNLIVCGSRDCAVTLFDHRANAGHQSKFIGHHGEVCGLAWNTNRNLLATGGNDNNICIWDVRKPKLCMKKLCKHEAAVSPFFYFRILFPLKCRFSLLEIKTSC